MARPEPLGHIDCPTCGTAGGMRVTRDKNGDPFGFCEAKCGQQLRVGGDPYRVAEFVARYAWAASKRVEAEESRPVSVPDPVIEAQPIKPVRKGTGNALIDLVQGVMA